MLTKLKEHWDVIIVLIGRMCRLIHVEYLYYSVICSMSNTLQSERLYTEVTRQTYLCHFSEHRFKKPFGI